MNCFKYHSYKQQIYSLIIDINKFKKIENGSEDVANEQTENGGDKPKEIKEESSASEEGDEMKDDEDIK